MRALAQLIEVPGPFLERVRLTAIKPGRSGSPQYRALAEPMPVKERAMKILLPVDGSAYTKRMLAYIAAHDELLGPAHDYLALHVAAPVPAFAARFLGAGSLDQHYAEAAAQ